MTEKSLEARVQEKVEEQYGPSDPRRTIWSNKGGPYHTLKPGETLAGLKERCAAHQKFVPDSFPLRIAKFGIIPRMTKKGRPIREDCEIFVPGPPRCLQCDILLTPHDPWAKVDAIDCPGCIAKAKLNESK